MGMKSPWSKTYTVLSFRERNALRVPYLSFVERLGNDGFTRSMTFIMFSSVGGWFGAGDGERDGGDGDRERFGSEDQGLPSFSGRAYLWVGVGPGSRPVVGHPFGVARFGVQGITVPAISPSTLLYQLV